MHQLYSLRGSSLTALSLKTVSLYFSSQSYNPCLGLIASLPVSLSPLLQTLMDGRHRLALSGSANAGPIKGRAKDQVTSWWLPQGPHGKKRERSQKNGDSGECGWRWAWANHTTDSYYIKIQIQCSSSLGHNQKYVFGLCPQFLTSGC